MSKVTEDATAQTRVQLASMSREDLEVYALRLHVAQNGTYRALWEFQRRYLDHTESVDADVLRFAVRIGRVVETVNGRAPCPQGDHDAGVLAAFLKERD